MLEEKRKGKEGTIDTGIDKGEGKGKEKGRQEGLG